MVNLVIIVFLKVDHLPRIQTLIKHGFRMKFSFILFNLLACVLFLYDKPINFKNVIQ